MDITQLKEGEKAKIIEIRATAGIIKKLDAIGIRPKVEIKKISSHFLRGPQTLEVGTTQLAIGFGIAKKIIVEKI